MNISMLEWLLLLEDFFIVLLFLLKNLNCLLKTLIRNQGRFTDERICINPQGHNVVECGKICMGISLCYASMDNLHLLYMNQLGKIYKFSK